MNAKNSKKYNNNDPRNNQITSPLSDRMRLNARGVLDSSSSRIQLRTQIVFRHRVVWRGEMHYATRHTHTRCLTDGPRALAPESVPSCTRLLVASMRTTSRFASDLSVPVPLVALRFPPGNRRPPSASRISAVSGSAER